MNRWAIVIRPLRGLGLNLDRRSPSVDHSSHEPCVHSKRDRKTRGVGIIEALSQMHKSVVDKLGEDRVLEWDEEKETLNIPDPYFLYYLRWATW